MFVLIAISMIIYATVGAHPRGRPIINTTMVDCIIRAPTRGAPYAIICLSHLLPAQEPDARFGFAVEFLKTSYGQHTLNQVSRTHIKALVA